MSIVLQLFSFNLDLFFFLFSHKKFDIDLLFVAKIFLCFSVVLRYNKD